MKTVVTIMAVWIAVVFIGSTFASPPGRNVEYAGGGAGKVIFDGRVHADQKIRCADCHPKIFTMKKESRMTMADHNANRFCFACHDGKRAFSAANNCAKCHKK